MSWSFKINLLPGEDVVEDGFKKASSLGIMPDHTVVLTNQRVLVRYNTFSTGLVRAFPYGGITEATQVKRFKIDYLKFSADSRDYFLKVDDPAGWATKILFNRDKYKDTAVTTDKPFSSDKAEILGMLDRLRTEGLLTDAEFNEKRRRFLGFKDSV